MRKYNSIQAISIGLLVGVIIYAFSNLLKEVTFLHITPFYRQVVLKILLALVSIFLGVYFFKIPKKEFSLITNKKGVKSLKFIFIGMLLGAIATVIMLIFKLKPIPLLKELTPLQMIIATWFFSTICEEIFCRGFIQNLVTNSNIIYKIVGIEITKPILTSAILFGLMHLTILYSGGSLATTLLVMTSTFALGLVCGFLKEKNGLKSAIFGHLAFNIGGVITALLLKIFTNIV